MISAIHRRHSGRDGDIFEPPPSSHLLGGEVSLLLNRTILQFGADGGPGSSMASPIFTTLIIQSSNFDNRVASMARHAMPDLVIFPPDSHYPLFVPVMSTG